jgi:ATP-dependent RNA helicase RhlE
MSDITFHDLNLNNALYNALDDLGLSKPTAIQEQSFSAIMSGKDVLGISQTGSGKTFAYLIPLIRLWQFSKKRNPEIIIVVPTRELVVQVVEEFEKLAKYTNMKAAGAYGGTNIRSQMDAIHQGADVVVATPGRMLDLILNRTIPAPGIKKIVIDEVDEILKLGFRAEIKNLVDLLPDKRQTLMFSATLNADIDILTENSTHKPIKIETGSATTTAITIEHSAYAVPNINTKINLIAHLLRTQKEMTKVLIFAGNKRMADRVNAQLEYIFPDDIAVIHGNKNQNTRLKRVEEFESGKCRILVASDLVARGIDVTDISHVINLDVPEIVESYIHRVGRTGRADKSGQAITLYKPDEEAYLRNIETVTGNKMIELQLPDEVEISTQLLPEEEYKPGMKIIQLKPLKDIEKGAAFHEKKDKNKKVPIKVSREDKHRIRLGKLYGTKHGGLGKKGKK